MRVDGVVVVEPSGQLVDHGSGVGLFGDADVIPLHGAHERLGHAVGLWAFDRGCARPEVDLAGKAAGFSGGVAAAIVGQPFDSGRQAVHAAEAVLDGGDHEVAHVLGGYAGSGSNEAHCLAIAAVEREGDPHLLAVVAADLEAVGAPAGVAGIDRDAPIVATLVTLAAMALEQQAMHLHHPVDALGIGRRWPAIARLPPQERMDPAVAIGRQIGDQALDTRDELFLGQWRSAAAACRSLASG